MLPTKSRTYSKTRENQDISTLQAVLLLYLLHHPSHPYQISKKFKEAGTLWRVPKTKGIAHPSKLYSQLDSLAEIMGGLVKRRPLPEDRRRKVEYVVCWERVLGANTERWDHEIQQCGDWIRMLSHDELTCITQMATISRFDLLTVLLYLDILTREIDLYAKPWIQKILRSDKRALARIRSQSLLDFSKAENVLGDRKEVERVIQIVRGLLDDRKDALVFNQRGLASLMHGSLRRLEKEHLEPRAAP